MLGSERPIAAHMVSMYDGMTPKLVVFQAGNFDMINFVEETTGVQEPIFANLYDEIEGMFMCNEATKDCDMWR